MTPSPGHRWILASAGSGKTFQLAHHLIGLLAHGEAPDRILATTFTRKAAAEIFDRVVSRLAAAALDERALASLNGALGALELPAVTLGSSDAARLLRELIEAIHRARVLTIDAWLAQLAGVMSFELDAGPGWSIADEERDQLIRLEAIDRMLEEGDIEALVLLLRMVHSGFGQTVHDAILGAVGSAHAAFLATEDHPGAWAWPHDESGVLAPASLAAAIDRLAVAPVVLTAKGEQSKRWTQARERAVAAASDGRWEEFVSKGLPAKVVDGSGAYYGQELPDELATAIETLVRHATATQLRDLHRSTVSMRRLVESFDRHYTAIKRATGAQRFDDIPRLLLDAGDTALTDLFFRLDAGIDHVLLDEFQDTSVIQLRLLEPVLSEILAHRESGRSVFVVGDPKQSLYGWRDAEPELLVRLPELFPALGGFRALDTSWRSSPAVLETVNDVFTDIASNPALAGREARRSWQELFRPHRAAAPNQTLAGEASLRVAPEIAPDDPAPDAAIRHAVDRALAIASEAPGATVAVLTRTNKPIPYLIAELRRRGTALALDASEEGGSRLIDAPPVAAALALLRLADHPSDTAARYQVATTPLGQALGYADWRDDSRAHELASGLRERFAREGYAAVFHGLLLEIASGLDERGARRFAQLVDLAAEVDRASPVRPSDAARSFEKRRVENPSGARVRVMTVHASKGLEFDAVVLPDLAGRWGLRGSAPLVDRATPFEPPERVVRYANEALRALDPDLQQLYERTLDREAHQELCVLYVAMTRAARLLEMIVRPGDKEKGYERGLGLDADSVVRSALAPGDPVPPGGTLWSRSVGDWRDGIEAPPVSKAEPVPRVRVRAPRHAPVARMPSVAPSSLEGDATVDGASLLRGASRGASIGSLFHHWFERIEWLEGDGPGRTDLIASAVGAGLDGALAEQHAGRWLAALEEPSIRSLFDREAAAARLGSPTAEARREWPFAVLDAGPHGDRVLAGRLDRLVVSPSLAAPERAEIIDFKTDAVPAALDALVVFYAPQIGAYRRAVASLLGLDADAVGARLAFTSVGAVVDVPSAG